MGFDIIGATSNLASTAATLGTNFGALGGLSVPAPNILSNYASYTYVIGLHSLTTNELNFPDQSYLGGKVMPIICKSAMADPVNRIQTPNFGKQDFFINNLTFETLIGHNSPKTTSLATIQFDVIEPYSIGLFINALQTAAIKAGHSNWRDAPFLLSVEFRGNTENGMLKKIPFSTRYIPLKFATIEMNSSEQGTRYLINAFGTQGIALTKEFASLRSDTSIKGTTVQEVLQTGEQSLQAVVNNKLRELVKPNGPLNVADQIVILFPKPDSSSTNVSNASGTKSSKKNVAYVNPQQSADSGEVFQKIGVNPSTLEQAEGSVNEVGAAKLGFNPARLGDPPPGNAQDTWDPVLKIWLRGKLVANAAEGEFKFSQAIDIPTVINQIILASEYAEKATSNIDPDGMITWWRIDTQTYYVQPKANETITGKSPKIAVYRVIPFRVHYSKVAGSGTQAPGFDALKAKAIKRYDYIFTGKNTEVIKFNIDYNVGFSNSYASDAFLNSIGVARQKNDSIGDNKERKTTYQPAPEGAAFQQADRLGGQRQMNNFAAQSNSQDGVGGTSSETALQRLGKTFHDAITNPYDMVMLDLEILGDPFWFVTSGMGNYNAKSVKGYKDLNQDGSVNWQSSQVDVIVNFRTPIDINQTTGLYDFKGPNHMDMTKDPKAGPAIGFTGLYCVNVVKNHFTNGTFRQVLSGYRRNGQEFTRIATDKNLLSAKNPGPAQAGK